MGFINQISDKPNWEEKVFDETIVAKWKEEAKMASHQNLDGDVFLSDKMFENVSSTRILGILITIKYIKDENAG